jgi:GTP cyclohydrolase II
MVAYLLNLSNKLEVLTNNPAKIRALSSLGITADRAELSVAPNPHNNFYLDKKKGGGHMISQQGGEVTTVPHSVKKGPPHRLGTGAGRFTHVAAYELPLRPPPGTLVIPPDSLDNFQAAVAMANNTRLSSSVSVKNLSSGELLINFDNQVFEQASKNKSTTNLSNFVALHTYNVSASVYHDNTSVRDFVTLEYCKKRDAEPLVRIFSESYLGRFPLAASEQRDSYHRAIQTIVENGNGMALLYPEDGAGNGFGTEFLIQRALRCKWINSREEAADLLGITQDARDYKAVTALLRHLYQGSTVGLIFTNQDSQEERSLQITSFQNAGIDVNVYDLDKKVNYIQNGLQF